jgi:hypothetical protein
MPRWAGWIATAVIAVAPSAQAANSPDFDRFMTAAKGLYGALEFERALEQLALAQHRPHEAIAEVELATFQGILLADLDKRAESDAAFRTALFVDPEAALTVRVSPKVAERFEALRREVKATLGASAPRRVPPPPAPSAAPPPQVATSGPPSRTWAWVVVGTGALCAGSSTYLLVQARSNWNALQSGAVSSAPAALTTRDQGKADQTAGLIVGGLGAATLATSAWLFLRAAPSQPQPTLSVSPGGVGASVRIAF